MRFHSEAITSEAVDGGIRLSEDHILPGDDHLETIQQSQFHQRRAGAAAAGGGSQSHSDTTAMQFTHHADCSRYRSYFEPHLPEYAIFALAEFLELEVRTVPKKVPQDVAALAAIQNEIQFGLRHLASEGLEKQPPSLAVHCMTVDEHTVHIKDDTAQLIHDEVAKLRPAPRPGHVICAL